MDYTKKRLTTLQEAKRDLDQTRIKEQQEKAENATGASALSPVSRVIQETVANMKRMYQEI